MQRTCRLAATIAGCCLFLQIVVGQDYLTGSCIYAFTKGGDIPQFNLPNTEFGTTLLNGNNPLTHAEDGSAVTGSCAGEEQAFQLSNGNWSTRFVGRYDEPYDFDFFSMTNNELFVGTVEPKHDKENFYKTLNNTIIRLHVTCGTETSDVGACVEFTGNLAGYDQLPFPATCYHGFKNGELAPFFVAPMASPLGPGVAFPMSSNNPIIEGGAIEDGLGWWAGFDGQDGNELSNPYWTEWWSQAASNEGSASCTGGVAEMWDVRSEAWVDTYTLDNETALPLDMFYAQEVAGGTMELYVKEIENWMAPTLYDRLQFNYMRLNLTCPASLEPDSCVLFKPLFSNWSPRITGEEEDYRFQDPAFPSIEELPAAVPNSPGDFVLFPDNKIVNKTGEEPITACNGDQAEYLGEDGLWRSNYTGSDGVSRALDHVFYTAYQSELWISTIQAVWSPNIEATLMNRTIRLHISCYDRGDDIRTEQVSFQVGAEPLGCGDLPVLCEGTDFSLTEDSSPASSILRGGLWGGLLPGGMPFTSIGFRALGSAMVAGLAWFVAATVV